jgi:hypothetical protein
MPYAAPVIVVPGITATQLRDEYILPPDIVWSAVMNKEYERIALHPDNIRFGTMCHGLWSFSSSGCFYGT